LETTWKFFPNPENPSKITPHWLNFEVRTELPEKMYAGKIIIYFVQSVLNIPQTRVTEITYVNEPNHFVDEQRVGPYKMWYHQHIFTKYEDGDVMMEDIVSHVIPLDF